MAKNKNMVVANNATKIETKKVENVKTEAPKVEIQKVQTLVYDIMPLLIKGGTEEVIAKKVIEIRTARNDMKTIKGVAIDLDTAKRNIRSILREIVNERKGWWSTYKFIEDKENKGILKVEKRLTTEEVVKNEKKA